MRGGELRHREMVPLAKKQLANDFIASFVTIAEIAMKKAAGLNRDFRRALAGTAAP